MRTKSVARARLAIRARAMFPMLMQQVRVRVITTNPRRRARLNSA
jgi:hypothetical protein